MYDNQTPRRPGGFSSESSDRKRPRFNASERPRFNASERPRFNEFRPRTEDGERRQRPRVGDSRFDNSENRSKRPRMSATTEDRPRVKRNSGLYSQEIRGSDQTYPP